MKKIEEHQVKSQTDAVLWHLQNNGTITSWQAIKEYGITRLADKILTLRKRGYDISSEPLKKKTRFGSTTTVSMYLLNMYC